MTQLTSRALKFSSGSLALEGVLHLPPETPAPAVVVCHPHPQYGGDMENNVVVAACDWMIDRGYAALRFNFRGAGASEGGYDSGVGERDDVRAALAYLGEQPEVDAKRLGLIGYSFGAMVAAEAASGALRALALVSPPLAVADMRVGWGCPALVLGGDSDDVAPAHRLQVLGEQPGAELEIVQGADHSWWGFEDDLGDALVRFFDRHFQ